MPYRLLSTLEVYSMLRIGRTTLWRWMRDPKLNFPQPIQTGPNSRVWREDELEAWIAARPRGNRRHFTNAHSWERK